VRPEVFAEIQFLEWTELIICDIPSLSGSGNVEEKCQAKDFRSLVIPNHAFAHPTADVGDSIR
jgi:hypothetical protein